MEGTNENKETAHKQLLQHLLPLIDFMDQNGYSYFLVAGKDGVCARYMRGNNQDVTGMLTGMAEKTPQIKAFLHDALNDMKTPPTP